MSSMTRRDFIRNAAAGAVAAGASPLLLSAAQQSAPSPSHLPRWRGFNLLEKFTKRQNGNPPFQESDFSMIRDFGFNFVRLPMSYLCWADPNDWLKFKPEELSHIDDAVAMGQRLGIHVNINFHRAPGYCVNPPKEPLDLWTDEKALDACAFHWGQFARRYKGIASKDVSFDLLNEPPAIAEDVYARVVKRLVAAIRVEDPNRLVIADGLRWGTAPVPSLSELKVAQSTRGYEPMEISHYKASWINGSDKWPEPTWPLKREGKPDINQETLRKTRIEPWKALEKSGVGVHVGEWGPFNRTPHKVALAWMRDCLDLWKDAGWGWAMWNFRGPFGILDSQRGDVNYEDFHGRKLDREMLKLIQAA